MIAAFFSFAAAMRLLFGMDRESPFGSAHCKVRANIRAEH